MPADLQPVVVDLHEDDVRSILSRNNVGRVAFVHGGEVEIRPLHYVHRKGRIYGRTGPSATLLDAEPVASRVAFEVDEIESVFQWKSVIVKGTMRPLIPEGDDAEEWATAAALLTRVVRRALGKDDPLPQRNTIIRITVEQWSGRASAPHPVHSLTAG